MGYTKSDLKTSLKTMFTVASDPITMQQHCIDMAKIYDDYCKNVIEDVANNPLVSTGKSSFQTSMEAYLTIPIPSLSGYASTIENACISYWDSCQFGLSNIPSGWGSLTSISVVAMASGSISILSANLTSAKGDPELLSEQMADIIHTATGTVSVTLVGTSSVGSPLTATAQLKAPPQ